MLALGHTVEKVVAHYLEKKGLSLLVQNFRSKLGEIDLIMRDKSHLIFIEVRYRNHPGYGNGLESVTSSKQKRIFKTAQWFLLKNPRAQTLPCRFDVVCATGPLRALKLNWVQDAFRAS